MYAGQMSAYPTNRADEFSSIVVMFFDAGGNGQNIGVKNDVEWIEVHLLGKDAVGTLGDFDATFKRGGLSGFVETHYHAGGPKPLNISCMTNEDFFALF